MLPTPMLVVVPNEFETVPAVLTRGYVKVRADCLLLNVVQLADERQPAFDPSATVQPILRPEPMILWPAVVVMPPEEETVPVATEPSLAGVPLVDVQYES